MLYFQSALGLVVFISLAWFVRERRREAMLQFPWRFCLAALATQLTMGAAMLKLPGLADVFRYMNDGVQALTAASRAGTGFVFSYLGGGPLPFAESTAGASFVLAFQALPIVLLISALSALLFHWRILPILVGLFARGLHRTLGVSGPVGLGAAVNIFVGMVEAPILIRPYIAALGRCGLFQVMTCGMATIAGTVLVLYARFLDGIIANPTGHILTASVISAPAALLIARLMVPPAPIEAKTSDVSLPPDPDPPSNAIEALARGGLAGAGLLINIIAMLIVFVALVHLVNAGLGLLPDVMGAPITLERILSLIMAPAAWLMGIPWEEALRAGELLGIKTVLNELLAYLRFAALPPEALGDRSRVILTYALCGFANFGSLGIMIGGLAAIAPERRAEIAGLGMKSILSGTLATLMTGSVAGLLTW